MMIQIENTYQEEALKIRDFVLSNISSPDNLDFEIKKILTFIEIYDKDIKSYIYYDSFEEKHYLQIFKSGSAKEALKIEMKYIECYWG